MEIIDKEIHINRGDRLLIDFSIENGEDKYIFKDEDKRNNYKCFFVSLKIWIIILICWGYVHNSPSYIRSLTIIIFVSLISSPEGIKRLTGAYSKVQIITACLDEKLNSKGYILPALGDAGDRIYNTLD